MKNDNNNIDFDTNYFILMHPLEGIPELITYTTNHSREKWVKCTINKNYYLEHKCCKVRLESLEEGYGCKKISTDDFVEYLKEGYIVKEEEGMECVEEEWIESLYKNNYLHHKAYVLKRKEAK